MTKEIAKSDTNVLLNIDEEVLDTVFKRLRESFALLSSKPTPRKYISTKQDFDYIKRHYLRNEFNKAYPINNVELISSGAVGKPGNEWWRTHLRVHYIDSTGNKRFHDMESAHRIQYLTVPAPTAQNPKARKKTDEYSDIGNDIKASFVDCYKKLINFATGIGDDVYKYQDEILPPEFEGLLNELIDIADYAEAREAMADGRIGMNNIKVTVRKIINKIDDDTYSKKITEAQDKFINHILGE